MASQASRQMLVRKRLRSADIDIYLIGKCEPKIIGLKLPSKNQVLKFFFYNVRHENKTVKESAGLVIDEILPFWERARIPTPDKRTCIAKMIKLYNDWRTLQKNCKSSFPSQRQKETDFKYNLKNLFDIAHVDALTMISSEEDRSFLIKQREEGRVGSMAGVDQCRTKKVERKKQRLEKEQRRRENYEKKNSSSELMEILDELDDSESDELENESAQMMDEDYNDNIASCSKQPVKIRRKEKFIDDRMLACMDAGNLSSPFAIRFLTATAIALGHDVHNLVLNCTSLRKQRNEFRRRQGKDLIESFKIPETFVLHWDGKLLPAISGREKVDRLTIVLTAENVEKLIAIPIIEMGTGATISQSIFDYLTKLDMVNVLEMICFDTTATNTGCDKGAGVLLEQKLQRSLLWLPCRHHIAELILKAIFEHNFGKSSGPEVVIFERFARAWSTFNINEFSTGIVDEQVLTVLSSEVIEERKNTFLECLAKEHIRHDYRELLQLALVFLGSQCSNFSFRSPGATSHARFMAKAIYSLKMYLFHKQFAMASKQLNGIRNVCIFLVHIYIPYWFRSAKSVEAPNADLQLIKQIINYFDAKTSLVLLEKFQNHLWYLSEEAVALAFFDTNVDVDVKRNMVLALHINDEGENEDELIGSCPKKVNANIQELQSFSMKDLSDFVSPKTKRFFIRMEIDMDFLHTDPSNWNEREDFCNGAQKIRSISVVNDAAERKVKLITDFNRSLTHNEEDKQYLLHIVENYRKDFPSYTKSSLLSNI